MLCSKECYKGHAAHHEQVDTSNRAKFVQLRTAPLSPRHGIPGTCLYNLATTDDFMFVLSPRMDPVSIVSSSFGFSFFAFIAFLRAALYLSVQELMASRLHNCKCRMDSHHDIVPFCILLIFKAQARSR